MRPFAAVVVLVAPALAEAVDLQHQGRILGASGTPLDGSYALTVRLWGQATGGTPRWEGTVTTSVADGYYTVSLTGVDPSHLTGDVWVGVQIGSDPELAPRQPLRTAPRAATLDPGARAGGELVLASLSGSTCTTPGAISYAAATGSLRVCHGGAWRAAGTGAVAGGTGATIADPGISCRTIKLLTGTTTSQNYYVDPDLSGNPISVYCDMSTDGGGWTLVTRASDTNGLGDYEFATAVGEHSVLGLTFNYGAPTDAQYLLGLSHVLEPGRDEVEIEYLCYQNTNRAATEYWVRISQVPVSALVSSLTADNPDLLLSNVTLTNKDLVVQSPANFAHFKRWSQASNYLSCGNSYGGQSGAKYSCAVNGQGVLSPRSVWFLTHYTPANGAFTEVNSCGANGGSILSNYRGEIRIR